MKNFEPDMAELWNNLITDLWSMFNFFSSAHSPTDLYLIKKGGDCTLKPAYFFLKQTFNNEHRNKERWSVESDQSKNS